MAELTHARVREVLDYDPQTGIFRWKVNMRPRGKAGAVAGSNHGNGYREIAINQNRHLAHRLAWFWMTGEWPNGQVDHIDLDRSNNAWGNLREATHAQNVYNSGPRSYNSHGAKGVTRRSYGKWHARIMHNRKLHILGNFDTKEEAANAYNEAAKRLHGEFARLKD